MSSSSALTVIAISISEWKKEKGWTKRMVPASTIIDAIDTQNIGFLREINKNYLKFGISYLLRTEDKKRLDYLYQNNIDFNIDIVGRIIDYPDEEFVLALAAKWLADKNYHKNDVLIHAIKSNKSRLLIKLLQLSAPVKTITTDDFTGEETEKIVQKRFDVRSDRNKNNISPVQYVFQIGSLECMNIILDHCLPHDPADEKWLIYVRSRLNNDLQYKHNIPYSRLAGQFGLGSDWITGRPIRRTFSL